MDIAVVANVERRVSVKTEDDLSVHGPSRLIKSEFGKKATNRDLPDGAHPVYRRDVVPSIWHWAAGNAPDPFNIDEHELVKALGDIWRRVYAGRISFNIPPIVSLVSVLQLNSDLLMTGLFRPINDFQSGAIVSRLPRPLHSHPSSQAMMTSSITTIEWFLHLR